MEKNTSLKFSIDNILGNNTCNTLKPEKRQSNENSTRVQERGSHVLVSNGVNEYSPDSTELCVGGDRVIGDDISELTSSSIDEDMINLSVPKLVPGLDDDMYSQYRTSIGECNLYFFFTVWTFKKCILYLLVKLPDNTKCNVFVIFSFFWDFFFYFCL